MCCFTIVLFLSLTSISTLTCADGYKILGFFPHPSKSHFDAFHPVLTGLAEKGHEVTLVTHYKLPVPIPRYKELILNFPDEQLGGALDLSWLHGYRFEQWANSLALAYVGRQSCHSTLESTVVQELLKSDEKYDLVIIEFFNADCLAPFAYKFGVPLIGLSSCTIMPWTNERFALPDNPSYIPSTNILLSDRMTFLERVENTLMMLFHEVFFNVFIRALDNRLIKQHFGSDIPDITDIVHNASLLLANVHFSLNLPKPLVPAVVDIGGINVRKIKSLPNDLEKWVNESTHGVIYFSLGSMIKGHTFPEEQRQAFLRAFARLPQRVLWKWETDTMPGKPDNVMIQKWMPQLDILCHPNVKAFISHGGLLGMTEAVHCGVPAVVMPQYGDQFTNAKALEANGGGVILNLRQADEEQVYSALKTILDPNFRKGAQELSARFRDRPLPPLETAIYWVEYVARHRGAHHMRTAAVDMPFYKYFLLDVIAFLLLVFGVISVCLFYVAKMALRKICGCWNRPAAKVKSN